MNGFTNLQSFICYLKQHGQLIEINTPVDPYLEIAEIHRRVVAQEGPALLFKNVKGSNYPVVTNLFGTKHRVNLAFGIKGKNFIQELTKLPQELLPPSFDKLWQKRGVFWNFTKLGIKTEKNLGSSWTLEQQPNLNKLPLLTTWDKDGGPFITLPLVYTEHPKTKIHNLGMYRMQRYDSQTTGLHMQIGKGGGFHLAAARELNLNLPVNVFLGGAPAVLLSAIAPLPENVPELMLASLILGEKIKTITSKLSALPLLADAEFVLIGECNPNEILPEGPFGDHYGYYSLQHPFPVFRCKKVLAKKNAVYPATVVGKPRQEDYYIGNYLQEILSPLFPLVMPAVKDLWSYGETGYHSLAAAVVNERYKREAMVSAFRILGEGQLSLTKFLLLVNQPMDLKDFRSVLTHILQRINFQTDLFVFSNLSMDTLDYCGPKLNEGSKGVMVGIGDPIRALPREFTANPPQGVDQLVIFCPGCLVISGSKYSEDPNFCQKIAQEVSFNNWPLIVVCDDAKLCTQSTEMFLWTTFTRFEPAADIYAKSSSILRFHSSLEMPIIIDARMKPNYPDELICDELTDKLVTKKWSEYFQGKF